MSQKDNIYIVHLQSITSYVSFGFFNFVGCNTLPIAANRRVSYVQMNSDLISFMSLWEQNSCTVSCVIWSRHQLLRCRSLRALMIDDPSACAPRIVMSQLQYLRAELRQRGVVRMRRSPSAALALNYSHLCCVKKFWIWPERVQQQQQNKI